MDIVEEFDSLVPEQLTIEQRKLIHSADPGVAITGAGLSRASGLPLLDTVVHGVPLREFFRGDLLRDDPSGFYKLYRELLDSWERAEPNPGHVALARSGFAVITQNIDGLHRAAGSQHVIELHGNFRELRCPACDLIESSARAFSMAVPKCPRCEAVMKPGVVLEGDEVRHISQAIDWVGRADVVLVVGTKLEMYPARRIPEAIRRDGLVVDIHHDAEDILPELLPIRTAAELEGLIP